MPVVKLPFIDKDKGKVIHPQYDMNIEIGEEMVEKTYEMYLEEKKLKKELETEQTETTTEEQDEEINNDSSDSGNANPNQ